jgi:hypothetical protein
MSSASSRMAFRQSALNRAQNSAGQAQHGQSEMRDSLNFARTLEHMASQLFQHANQIGEQRNQLFALQQMIMSGGLQDSEIGAFQAISSQLSTMATPQSYERQAWSFQDASESQIDRALFWRQEAVASARDAQIWEEQAVSWEPVLEPQPVQETQPAPTADWEGVKLYGWDAPVQR